jgi:hypothetical protein
MFALADLPDALPANHSREWIFGGKLGTAQTISRMRDLASVGKRDQEVRKVVGQLIQKCPPKDYLCYARSVFEFCRDQIKYVFDPSGVEFLESPRHVLAAGMADCDSVVMLLAAMLESIGMSCRYVTIKADRDKPDDYSHVFLECQVPGHGWVPMDATMSDKPFGWGPSKKWPRKEWPASRDVPENHESEMGYLGSLNDLPGFAADEVPGVEDTVGVAVGNLWKWREEDALQPYVAGQLETTMLKPDQTPIDPGVYAPEMFQRENMPEVLSIKKQSALAPRPVVAAERGAMSSQTKKFILFGGIALLGYLYFRGK